MGCYILLLKLPCPSVRRCVTFNAYTFKALAQQEDLWILGVCYEGVWRGRGPVSPSICGFLFQFVNFLEQSVAVNLSRWRKELTRVTRPIAPISQKIEEEKIQTLETFVRRDIQQQATHQSHTLFHWFCSTFLRNFLSLGKSVGNPSNHRTHCRLAKIHQVTGKSRINYPEGVVILNSGNHRITLKMIIIQGFYLS